MIRTLDNKDINRVMEIWLKSTIKGHNFISSKYWEENYDKVKSIYIPMSTTFVYEDEKEIKGFISIIENQFIGALFVHNDSQGEGIGKKLIDYIIDKYKNLNLAVYKDNEKAVKFYKNRGFKVVKTQENEDTKYLEYIMST